MVSVVHASGPRKPFSSSGDDAQPPNEKRKPRNCGAFCDGASRARTGDLLGAIQALSQLSYSPVQRPGRAVGDSVAPQVGGWPVRETLRVVRPFGSASRL